MLCIYHFNNYIGIDWKKQIAFKYPVGLLSYLKQIQLHPPTMTFFQYHPTLYCPPQL